MEKDKKRPKKEFEEKYVWGKNDIKFINDTKAKKINKAIKKK